METKQLPPVPTQPGKYALRVGADGKLVWVPISASTPNPERKQ